MITSEDLVIGDGQVVRQVLSSFNVCPQMMLPLNSFERFESRMKFVKFDKQLSKACFSFKELYELCIASVFKILPKNYGSYGLFSNTGKDLKPSLQPLRLFLWAELKLFLMNCKMRCPICL